MYIYIHSLKMCQSCNYHCNPRFLDNKFMSSDEYLLKCLFSPVQALGVFSVLFTLLVHIFSLSFRTAHFLEGEKEGGLLTCCDVYVLS